MMGLVERHVAGLASCRPGQDELAILGVKHVHPAVLRDGHENSPGGVVHQDLARLKFLVDHVPEEFVTSRVNDPDPTIIKTGQLAAVTDVKILAGRGVEGTGCGK